MSYSLYFLLRLFSLCSFVVVFSGWVSAFTIVGKNAAAGTIMIVISMGFTAMAVGTLLMLIKVRSTIGRTIAKYLFFGLPGFHSSCKLHFHRESIFKNGRNSAWK